MSGETLYERPRTYAVSKMRVHDYLYDSAFIVSGARDYARTAFKAAMASAQLTIQPVYHTMFSELRKCPRMRVVYYPNCRLPEHMDRSYSGYVERVQGSRAAPAPQLQGKDRFKFSAIPKKVLAVPTSAPEFNPPTPMNWPTEPGKPKNRGTQSMFRESSAQTTPWQPDGRPADECNNTPEVLHLDCLKWGPGRPYRLGDLPADFHTTEIINKLRHARMWSEVVEKATFPRWMKKRAAIISDVETKDWIFREAEIDELQEIRLELLHSLQSQQREKQSNRTSRKLSKLWECKKQEMQRKIDHIRRTRDRELRKLQAQHGACGRGRGGVRGGGAAAAADRASELHAPLARHGYQARRRHARIHYDPALLSLEDHEQVSRAPAWVSRCGRELALSCSGHRLPRDPAQLCERETKWSEQFLENLHNDLKKARMGAAGGAGGAGAGGLHVVRARRQSRAARPATAEVDAVPEADEAPHQAALTLQRLLCGRAVQTLMYEGRTRAAELTEELKMTHGLQKEDKIRIAREEAKAREYNAMRSEAEQKDDAITALVEELCGGAVSAALHFLEKELRRLKEERRQHAFILIALREKAMREAAEAGRRQKEEHRRREHDEMFKQVLGVTQETVDAYLMEVVQEGVELAAEEDAVKAAQAHADSIDLNLKKNEAMSTAEQSEAVAQLVQQFLLPHAHRAAARLRLHAHQRAREHAARDAIFGLLDDADQHQERCTQCGSRLESARGSPCRCARRHAAAPATSAAQDPRWALARRRERAAARGAGERFPPAHEIRCMLNTLLDEAVVEARTRREDRNYLTRELRDVLQEGTEKIVEAMGLVEILVERATGARPAPARRPRYHHYMTRELRDALARSEPFSGGPCPKELPSERRRREEALTGDKTCRCDEPPTPKTKVLFEVVGERSEGASEMLLPSELRALEELRRCKCDTSPDTSPDFSPRQDSLGEDQVTDVEDPTPEAPEA